MTEVWVNLLWLAPGRVGGSEESTLASLRALHDQRDASLRLRLAASDALLAAHPDLRDRFAVETLPGPAGSRPVRIAAESSWLAARTRGAALVHHAGGTVPPVRTAPAMLTLHDLQPLERRATHGPIKRAYLGLAVPRSIEAARVVVVPSGFVRERVLDRFGADPAKVVVVPHGVEAPPPRPPDELEALRRRHRLDAPVVLYPAITYPHKNHAVLVEAFAEALRQGHQAVLVLTGGAGAAEGALSEQIDRLGVRERVRRLGRVPSAELHGLYQLATVVAVPSRYEGFGLPAAEAMAHGRALVAARATALPEVAGDAAVLVGPDDVAGWARAIGVLLDDPAERARRVEAGRARADSLSWAANARGLLGAYRQALAAPPP
ncbi:MAG: glycosyltransferase family 4 protein [Acidimicrobiia bacterium]